MLKTQRFFYLALLGHLLLFLSYSLTLIYRPEFIYKPRIEASSPVASYVYQAPMKSQIQSQKISPRKFPPLKKVPVSILGYKAPVKEMQDINQMLNANPYKPSRASQQRFQMKSDQKVSEPLLQLLSEATSSKLVYPQISIAFKQTGTVKLRFYIFPDGRITQVTLLQTSGFSPLDDAALDAIRAISPVRNTSLYLKKPQYITAYIEFREHY